MQRKAALVVGSIGLVVIVAVFVLMRSKLQSHIVSSNNPQNNQLVAQIAQATNSADIVHWQTYQSPKFGYQLKYPSLLQEIDSVDNAASASPGATPDPLLNNISLLNDQVEISVDVLQTAPAVDDTWQKITIGSLPALRKAGITPAAGYTDVVVIPTNSYTYEFVLYAKAANRQYTAIYNNILSTFQLVRDSRAV